MNRLSAIEEKISRLVERCRELELEANQGVVNFSEPDFVSENLENELNNLREQLGKKDDKLKKIASKMEKLENLVKDL